MTIDLERLSAGSPLLIGDGLISIESGAEAIGLSVTALLNELLEDRPAVYARAVNVSAIEVEDVLVLDQGDGTFDLNEVAKKGQPSLLNGDFRAFSSANTLSALLADKTALVDVAIQRQRTAFFPNEEIELPVSAWRVERAAIERIRVRLLKSISIPSSTPVAAPVALPLAATTPPAPVTAVVPTKGTDTIAVRHGHKTFSALFDLVKDHRQWDEGHRRRMTTEARLFAELMGDPTLETIDVEMIHKYAARLSQLPSDLYQARRRAKTSSLDELAIVAKREGLKLKGQTTVKGHVGRLGEILNFAVKKGMMHANPAGGFKREFGFGANKTRAQDERDAFTEGELTTIFTQDQFCKEPARMEGRDKINWRPYQFWTPILAITTGGRLNEISQLYLDDIRQSESGVWYIDFNLDQPDKTDSDEPDKKLKTVNAIRVMPIHDAVIRAGFLEYVQALRAAGETRLFPELKRDGLKGYGKPVGSWFNERFLGKKLGIARNGRKVFHSFRHTFATSLERLNVGERVATQLVGHERGKSQSFTRYAKDADADSLKPVIDQLKFPCLSGVVRFDVKAALNAIMRARRLKKSAAKKRSAVLK